MTSRLMARFLGLGAIWGLTLSLGLAADDQAAAIPADFQVVAQYGSGESDWKSWKTTIASDGKVIQEVFNLPNGPAKHESQLSRANLEAIQAKIRSADFGTLKRSYDSEVRDHATLLLTITANEQTHKVKVYAPDLLKNEEDVKRFLDLWSEVLRQVPSPNPEQKPDPNLP